MFLQDILKNTVENKFKVNRAITHFHLFWMISTLYKAIGHL